ncbi:MAG: FKBP-type peptidyl-prolyl cis-trans isomerase [Chlamydiae bacterium]|nr:FKBP-type peptidyl-prolyl cis-trans isomerase [Chlamydiota bacterium]
MHFKKVYFLFNTLICTTVLAAPLTEEQKKESSKISEAFGHLMAKHIEDMGVKFDIQYVIQGLKNASEGKSSPMTEEECVQAIAQAQEVAFKEQSIRNLAEAEQFLQHNGKTKGIISLEEGKVQYKVDQEGQGEIIGMESTPLVRFKGTLLNGDSFGASTEDDLLAMEELIPGLQLGMNGMHEGEKRTIYIHPDCAYGTKGALPPNSLLTFEIELVKAQGPSAVEQQVLSLPQEIALPDEVPAETIR